MAAFDAPRSHAGAGALRRRVGIRGAGVILATTTMVAGAALLPVVQSSKATTTGYEIRRLERQRADLEADIYNAQSDIAQLGSLERIDRDARERLGMIPATTSIVVKVDQPAPARRDVPARYLPIEDNSPAPRPASGGWRGALSRLLQR